MNILLGITGSIAACKAPALISSLRSLGHQVKVIITKSGSDFITPLTCRALSNNIVYTDFETADSSNQMDHISLARWADLFLIAPASANSIANLAHGCANDLLSTTYLATSAKIWIAPAMNTHMWQNPLVQKNIQILARLGNEIIDPCCGQLACGDIGPGRMAEPNVIIQKLFQEKRSDLQVKNVLLTVGATREKIDPIRFISNKSSGKMGYALAEELLRYNIKVTCISGNCTAKAPAGADIIQVQSAKDMHDAVMKNIINYDCFIAVAAVSDFTPKLYSENKIKKANGLRQISLQKTADILYDVANSDKRPKIVIGFAAETQEILKNAKTKLISKNCDAIIANHACKNNSGMQSDFNAVTILTKEKTITINQNTKKVIAQKIIKHLLEKKESNSEIH